MNTIYKEFVESKLKNPEDIVNSMTPEKANLIHIILGVEGEAGELLDPIKKHVIYGKDLDITNIEEELGDLEFFLEALRNALNLDRDKIIQKNIDKLNRRYPSGYSDKDAIERKDKNLKPGDRVFIREDLNDCREYGGVFWVDLMKKGQWVTYKENHDPAGNIKSFRIEEDNCNYSPEMIDWDKTLKDK